MPAGFRMRMTCGFLLHSISAFVGLEIHADSYLVILTRGHLHDKTVLQQALKTPAGYIGMIGSRKKRDAIYRALEKEGFSAGGF